MAECIHKGELRDQFKERERNASDGKVAERIDREWV